MKEQNGGKELHDAAKDPEQKSKTPAGDSRGEDDERKYAPAYGLAIGMGLGAALGAGFGNVPLGISLGLLFGVLMGAVFGKK